MIWPLDGNADFPAVSVIGLLINDAIIAVSTLGMAADAIVTQHAVYVLRTMPVSWCHCRGRGVEFRHPQMAAGRYPYECCEPSAQGR